MKTKIKLDLHLSLIRLLLDTTFKNQIIVSKSPHQHLVQKLVSKCHQKFYKLLNENFNTKNSKIIKTTLNYEEAYALDLFLSKIDLEQEDELISFSITLNQKIQ